MNSNSQPRLAFALMAVLLVVLPIEGTAALRNFLLAGILTTFGLYVHKHHGWRKLVFPLKWYWLAYGLVAVVGLYWAVDVLYSLSEIRHEIVVASVVFWLSYNLFKCGGLNWLLAGLVIGNVFLVGYCLVIWSMGGTTVNGLNGTYRTGVGNFSTYLVMVMPWLIWLIFNLKQQERRTYVFLLAVLVAGNVGAMFVTQNRQVFSSVLLEVLVIALVTRAWRHPQSLFPMLMSFFLMFGGFSFQSSKRGFAENVGEAVVVSKALEADGRLSRWRYVISNALSNPWVGGGLGRETFWRLNEGKDIAAGVFSHAHNMVLNRVVQLGIPGVFVFLLLFFSPAVRIFKGRGGFLGAQKDIWLVGLAVCAGMFAKNMTDDFFMRELGYFYWIIMAGVLAVQVPRNTERLSSRQVFSFLVIRRDNIGDLLCTTPLIRALRIKYPKARIDALVNSYNAPVLLGNPDLDHVHVYTKAKHKADSESVLGVYWGRVKLLWGLRRVRYEVVILAGDGNIERQLGLARWLNADCLVGFKPSSGIAVHGLDIAVPRLVKGHEVERTFALLAPLGIEGAPPKMVLVPEQKEIERVRIVIDYKKSGDTSPVVAMHISARKVPQRWPIERFAELMHAIHEKDGARFVLFWSPGDESNPLHPGDDKKAAALMQMAGVLPVIPYPTNQLPELVAALSVCSSMICSDGGAMHIGAALGLPIVCLFGNSDAARWYPWEGVYSLLQTDQCNVSSIDVPLVIEAYKKIGSNQQKNI